MTRSKYCFSAWVLGMAVVCSGFLLAQDEASTYPGGIGFDNPCNGSLVVVDGTNYLRIEDNSRDKGRGHESEAHLHVNVHLRFLGSGQDAAGNPYRTVFIAKGQFTAESTSYDLPFHSMWVGTNGTPNFSVVGTVRVVPQAQDGKPSSMITHFDTSCRAGDHDEDGDHDDSH